jgi:hypothetical protein
MSKRPNILFIMADQMKASILRIYSEIGIECPQIEKLATKSKYSSVINEMKNLLLNWMIETEDKTPVELPNKVGREFDFS